MFDGRRVSRKPGEYFADPACLCLAEMRIIDHDKSERVPVLLEMVAELSRADDPKQVLAAFTSGWARLNGPSGYISLSTRGLTGGQYRITRLLAADNVAKMVEADPWSVPPEEVHQGGLLGCIVEAGKPTIVTDLELRDDPILGSAIADYRTLMAVPLFDGGEPLNWAIQLRHEPDAFNTVELEESLLRGNLVGGTVRHVRTAAELRRTQQTLRGEVERIARIQRALLPDKLPEMPGVSIATSYETFDQAGGDMYLFHELGTSPLTGSGKPNGWWSVFIADVSGHGPSAAVVMAMVESILAAYPSQTTGGPGKVLNYLNEHLSAKRIENSFVTAFCAEIKPSEGRVTFARAGHPPPLVRQRDSKTGETTIRALDEVGGLPLGIVRDTVYDCTETRLNRDDTLVLFTDGITEARTPEGRFFGTQGVEQALRECTGTADCFVQTLAKSLQVHQAGRRPADDQTCVALHLHGI